MRTMKKVAVRRSDGGQKAEGADGAIIWIKNGGLGIVGARSAMRRSIFNIL